MFKYTLVLILITFLSAEVSTRFSPESVAGFMLSVVLGIFGWLGFEKGRGKDVNRDKVLATIGMAFCFGYVVDAYAWWQEFHTELRAMCVTASSYFSEPILAFIYVNRIRIFSKFFGNDKYDSKDGQMD